MTDPAKKSPVELAREVLSAARRVEKLEAKLTDAKAELKAAQEAATAAINSAGD